MGWYFVCFSFQRVQHTFMYLQFLFKEKKKNKKQTTVWSQLPNLNSLESNQPTPPKNYLTWKHRQYLHWEKMPDSFAFNLSLQSSLKIKEVSLRQLHFHANGQQKEWPSRKLLSESLSNQPAEQRIKTFKKVNGHGIRNLDCKLQGSFGWGFFFFCLFNSTTLELSTNCGISLYLASISLK